MSKKKFKYMVLEAEAETPDALHNVLTDPNYEEWELITIIPIQKVAKSLINTNMQHQVKMYLQLIFKQCQD